MLPEQLANAPTLPELTENLWAHFVNLCNERSEGRITSGMMRDYEWSEAVRLDLWQRKAIKRLDRILLEARDEDSD